MKKKISSRSNRIRIITTVFAGILAAAVLFLINRENSENAVIVRVNEEAVSVREFKQILIKTSSSIFSYFNQKYGATDSEDFWTKSYKGEIPIDKARKEALKEIVRIKIQQALAKQKGLLRDTSYSSFLTDLDAENQRRKEAVSKGQVIYGPQKYEEAEFFYYTFSKLLIDLKEKMSTKEIRVSDQEITNYYEVKKETEYKLPDTIKIKKFTISFQSEINKVSTNEKPEAKALADDVKAVLEKGASIDRLLNKNETIKALIKDEYQTFDGDSERTDTEQYSYILQEVKKMRQGQVSKIQEVANSFVIFKILEKKAIGYQSLELVKEVVKTRIMDSKYEKIIDGLVKKAKVTVDNKLYSSVLIR